MFAFLFAAGLAECDGPWPEHPECAGRISWMVDHWEDHESYITAGVDGSRCSIQNYLNEHEGPYCPPVPDHGSIAGCFRAEPTFTTFRHILTNEKCSEHCAGSEFSATGYFYKCACVGDIADWEALPLDECSTSCEGDRDQMCGGSSNRWSVTALNGAAPAPAPAPAPQPAPAPAPAPQPAPSGGAIVKIMSFNLYGWNAMGVNSGTRAHLLWNQIRAVNPDVLGTQENDNYGWVESETGLTAVPSKGHGVVILYKATVMRVLDHGVFNLEEQDRWGQRIVVWARFQHKVTGASFYHYNTHYCVCSENQLVGSARKTAAEMASRGTPAVLTGDLNVFGGQPLPPAIRYFLGETVNGDRTPLPLTDVLASVGATDSTFGGAGRIDWMLSAGHTQILTGQVLPYAGSDHDAITATLRFA